MEFLPDYAKSQSDVVDVDDNDSTSSNYKGKTGEFHDLHRTIIVGTFRCTGKVDMTRWQASFDGMAMATDACEIWFANSSYRIPVVGYFAFYL